MAQGLTGLSDVITERVVTLTDSTPVSVDASQGSIFDLTTTQSFTLSNPTNPTSGQKIVFRILQDSTGGRVITLDTKYRVPSDLTGFLLSTAGDTMDILGFIYNLSNDTWDMTGITKGYT